MSDSHCNCEYCTAARTDWNELRAAAAERDELKRKLSDLYAVINRDGGQAERDDPDIHAHMLERLTAQAAKMEQASTVIEHAYDDLRYMAIGGSTSRKMCKAWLAANAPAPEEERTE